MKYAQVRGPSFKFAKSKTKFFFDSTGKKFKSARQIESARKSENEGNDNTNTPRIINRQRKEKEEKDKGKRKSYHLV